MKIIKGNLWDSTDDIIAVTTNSYIRKDGALVMGRGAALECKQRYPGIEYNAGAWIRMSETPYGFIIVGHMLKPAIALFQVKYHFKDIANLDLIKFSTDKLNGFISLYKLYTPPTISMNFPSIGYGGRTIEEVLPIVSTLPDNVTLYMK